MKYVFRDPKALAASPPSISTRSAALKRVRVDGDDPRGTAERTPTNGHVYVQGLYDDPESIVLPDDEARMAYWTGWINAWLHHYDGTPDTIWIEHPYSIGARRLLPEWIRVFETLLALMRQRLGCPCLQFGVPSVSPNVYQVPLGGGLCGRDPGSVDGVWVNLPGQPAFDRDRRTTRDEFALGIAWAKAHEVPLVCLWSDPHVDRESAAEVRAWERSVAQCVEVIEFLDPAPAPGRPEDLPPGVFRQGDTFETVTERLAKAARGGAE